MTRERERAQGSRVSGYVGVKIGSAVVAQGEVALWSTGEGRSLKP